ncbi:response regulator [Mangrovicoccus algicola]|uniref:Response regulator n=1 Tax=Mangrovicoccus algicola TaxID=2771008 RepID=A0A8J6YV99_9RHOB|nr:response regulator [Mangrovicoccus algicola]MBE3638402.1 response regulator [Mangrovicoccus algicola]
MTQPAILLVDDEPLLLDMTAMACQGAGHPVHKASSGREALDLLQQRPEIGLLLTDIGLSREMDGFALASAARRLRPGLPVIFFSGYGDQAERPAEFREDGVLGKPVPIAVLRSAVAAHLPPPSG